MTIKAGPATDESKPHLGQGHPNDLQGVLALLTATPKAKILDLNDAPLIP
jgi:hypothetical protein